MSDQTINKKDFNLPAYINIPFFLYQDHRLEKSSTLIGSFFYSLYTSGKVINASTDYLCQLAGIKKRQLYIIMNQLEEYKYISRSGFTNRKKLHWIYVPNSSITIIENETSALQCTSDEDLNTSALQCTKLVHSNALNYCTPVHTDNKDYIKDNKRLTTVPPTPSSSSFFSQKQKDELIKLKLPTDDRTPELFLSHCEYHAEKQDNDMSKFQRYTGLKHILIKLHETQEHFKAKGFDKASANEERDNRVPTHEDFLKYKGCEKDYEWVGAWMQKQNKE